MAIDNDLIVILLERACLINLYLMVYIPVHVHLRIDVCMWLILYMYIYTCYIGQFELHCIWYLSSLERYSLHVQQHEGNILSQENINSAIKVYDALRLCGNSYWNLETLGWWNMRSNFLSCQDICFLSKNNQHYIQHCWSKHNCNL